MAGVVGAKRYTCGDELFEAESRGRIEINSLGEIDMYFLNRIRPEFSSDAHGILPNEAFWNKTSPQLRPRV
jgi:hypothetical protein